MRIYLELWTHVELIMVNVLELLAYTEHRFNAAATTQWMNEAWPYCLTLSAVYITLVHGGKWMMQDRKKFVLRKQLFLWNLALAIFSVIGFYKMAVPFVKDWYMYGLHETLCTLSWIDGKSGLWCFLSAIIRVPELLDTLFIILRKQNLIFLHWYHHVTVLCFSWYSHGNLVGYLRVFPILNYFVHSVMYTYYAIRAQGFIRVPRVVNIVITSLQLLQMAAGFAVNVYGYVMLKYSVKCNVHYNNVYAGFALYGSYAILFTHFFYVNYVKKDKSA
jgi:elongation of very long chain fatty acids protein 6